MKNFLKIALCTTLAFISVSCDTKPQEKKKEQSTNKGSKKPIGFKAKAAIVSQEMQEQTQASEEEAQE
jgi:starvation-inducible outer membrane lipoprotein